MKKWPVFFIVFILAAVLFAGIAGANGTLTATVYYNSQPLQYAYVYLHVYPPLGATIKETYFRNAQHILGPTNSSGYISASVPEGTYKVRITRRAPLTTVPTLAQAYGPPKPGDYTWKEQGGAITIATNSTVNLGAINTAPFSSTPAPAPITISGKATTCSGTPWAGVYIMATTQYCTPSITDCGGYGCWTGLYNACPGQKFPAQQLTDSNGNYTIELANPGTYYIYAMPAPESQAGGTTPPSTCHNRQGGYCPGCSDNYDVCPVTVSSSSNLTGVNINACN